MFKWLFNNDKQYKEFIEFKIDSLRNELRSVELVNSKMVGDLTKKQLDITKEIDNIYSQLPAPKRPYKRREK